MGKPACWIFTPRIRHPTYTSPKWTCRAQERRASLAAGRVGYADLLGVLLGARDEDGQPMTDEELWEVRVILAQHWSEDDSWALV